MKKTSFYGRWSSRFTNSNTKNTQEEFNEMVMSLLFMLVNLYYDSKREQFYSDPVDEQEQEDALPF